MDKKIALVIILISLFALGFSLFLIRNFIVPIKSLTEFNGNQTANLSNKPINILPKEDVELGLSKQLVEPISQALTRVTKKPFGIKISPTDSPVSPERFSGYHTGLDFETTVAEVDADVPVFAICDGKLLVKKQASGYGGVLVQSCQLDKQAITVVYGHVSLTSVNLVVGDSIKAGQVIAWLGKGFSEETDGERKHLHLSIHLGSEINIRGYVEQIEQLQDWLDPLTLLKNN